MDIAPEGGKVGGDVRFGVGVPRPAAVPGQKAADAALGEAVLPTLVGPHSTARIGIAVIAAVGLIGRRQQLDDLPLKSDRHRLVLIWIEVLHRLRIGELVGHCEEEEKKKKKFDFS